MKTIKRKKKMKKITKKMEKQEKTKKAIVRKQPPIRKDPRKNHLEGLTEELARRHERIQEIKNDCKNRSLCCACVPPYSVGLMKL